MSICVSWWQNLNKRIHWPLHTFSNKFIIWKSENDLQEENNDVVLVIEPPMFKLVFSKIKFKDKLRVCLYGNLTWNTFMYCILIQYAKQSRKWRKIYGVNLEENKQQNDLTKTNLNLPRRY